MRENNNKTFNYYGNELSKEYKNSRSRIMYIGYNGNGLEGPARIGRVYFSKSGKSIYYKGKCFQTCAGRGYKYTFFNIDSADNYWISGPRKDQNDRLYGGNRCVIIDDDIREEHLNLIRKK